MSFSTTLPSAPSKPRPARTEMVEQVQGVRDHEQDGLLALLHAAAQPELGHGVAEHAADRKHHDPQDQRQVQHPDHEEQQEEEPTPTIVPTALIPSQSATRRSPGLPARARRFSADCEKDALVTRAEPKSLPTRGRTVRSNERLLELPAPPGSWPASYRAGSGGPAPGPAELCPARRRSAGWRRRRCGDHRTQSIGKTSMSTILRINMKPMNIQSRPGTGSPRPGEPDERDSIVEHRRHEPGGGDEQETGQPRWAGSRPRSPTGAAAP